MKHFFTIITMALAFCCTKLCAQSAAGNINKTKDSMDMPMTFEDRDVIKEDYVNDTLRMFYNEKWDQTSDYGAVYYSIAYKKDASWICYDYYYRENKILHYVTFSDQELKHKQGLFVSYTSEGKLDELGNYDDNERTGDWLFYTDGRVIPDTTVYLKDMPVGRSVMHYADGKIRSVQEMDAVGAGIGKRTDYHDYDKAIIQESGIYSKGMKKDSTWVYFYPDGKMSFLEKYDKGTLQTINCYDMNGVSLDSCITEQPAEFPGGLSALMKFLSKNLKYPNAALENGVAGRVYIRFIVNKDGSLTNIGIKRDIGDSCGAEALRVVSLMPKWKPGRVYGNPVKMYFTLPVTFKLQ